MRNVFFTPKEEITVVVPRDMGGIITEVLRYKNESGQHVEALYSNDNPTVFEKKQRNYSIVQKNEYKKSIALFRDLAAILNPVKLKKTNRTPISLSNP